MGDVRAEGPVFNSRAAAASRSTARCWRAISSPTIMRPSSTARRRPAPGRSASSIRRCATSCGRELLSRYFDAGGGDRIRRAWRAAARRSSFASSRRSAPAVRSCAPDARDCRLRRAGFLSKDRLPAFLNPAARILPREKATRKRHVRRRQWQSFASQFEQSFFSTCARFSSPRFIRRFQPQQIALSRLEQFALIGSSLMSETPPPRERPNPPRPQAPPVNSVVAAATTAHDLDERRKIVLEAERDKTVATRPTRRSGRRRWGL